MLIVINYVTCISFPICHDRAGKPRLWFRPHHLHFDSQFRAARLVQYAPDDTEPWRPTRVVPVPNASQVPGSCAGTRNVRLAGPSIWTGHRRQRRHIQSPYPSVFCEWSCSHCDIQPGALNLFTAKFLGRNVRAHACKQCIFRSYNKSTFNAVRFDENPLIC